MREFSARAEGSVAAQREGRVFYSVPASHAYLALLIGLDALSSLALATDLRAALHRLLDLRSSSQAQHLRRFH